MEVGTFGELEYLVRYPKGYQAGQKCPVILFLHGAGTRQADIAVLKGNAFFTLTEPMEDFPFICYAPHCKGSTETWNDHFEKLKAFVRWIAEQPSTDADRLYLTGNSMGGYGTWNLAMSMPEAFAAIVPICGGGVYWNTAQLKNVPVWAFHGAKDTTVLPRESEQLVEHLNRQGGNAKLTVYPDRGHDCWTPTYQNPEVFDWMLAHTNCLAAPTQNEYADSKKFG